LVAQWDGAEWGDRGSNLSQGQVDYFQREMLPQVEKAIGLRREKQGELWIEVD
jgi:ligand-binding sensor domain-containing protein